ncbi:MAG: hypothetical protein WD851_06225 [Pirellulales bacterium]
MQIELPDQTIRDVQTMLAKRGEAPDIAQYVDQTLQRALFFDTVREIKTQNVGVDPDELERLIDQAVEYVQRE